jgi:hypothetical protein
MACVVHANIGHARSPLHAASLLFLAKERPRASGGTLVRNCVLGCGGRNTWLENPAHVTARGRPSVRNTWPRNLAPVTARRPRSVTRDPETPPGLRPGGRGLAPASAGATCDGMHRERHGAHERYRSAISRSQNAPPQRHFPGMETRNTASSSPPPRGRADLAADPISGSARGATPRDVVVDVLAGGVLGVLLAGRSMAPGVQRSSADSGGDR